jgi:hypothetical protein
VGLYHPPLPRRHLHLWLSAGDGIQLRWSPGGRTRLHDGRADRLVRLPGPRREAIRERSFSACALDASSRHPRRTGVELGRARADCRVGGA